MTNSYELTERGNRLLGDEQVRRGDRRIWLWGVYAMTVRGFAAILSSFGPRETMDRLEAGIAAKGMT
ncbi:MAG: hypothetical protein ACREC0_11055, partial [Methylocella sp.]